MRSCITKYALGVSVVTIISLIALPITANATLHSDNVAPKVDGREHPRINASVNDFHFSAENICNENMPKHGRCLDISGGGSTSANTIVANGNYITYLQKPIDLSSVQVLSKGIWIATDLLRASSMEMNFKAHASVGNVYVLLVEGSSENSGKVCAYGPLLAIEEAQDAVCVDALVVIGSMDNEQEITSIAKLDFSASNLCNADISSNGMCIDIWGKGGMTENTFAASGHFEIHPLESDEVEIRGHWEATDLFAASENHVSFKAASSSGNLFIKLTEGESDSGLACAYGPLIAIHSSEEVCVDDAFVMIATAGN